MITTNSQESKVADKNEPRRFISSIVGLEKSRKEQAALNELKRDISMCLKSVATLVDDPSRTSDAGIKVAKKLEDLIDKFTKCNIQISERLIQDIVKATEYLKAGKKFSKNDGTEAKSESEMNWDVLVDAKGALTSLANRFPISK